MIVFYLFTFLLLYLYKYGKFKVTRKRYCYLWYEQYYWQILELSAGATIHGKD